MASKWGCDTLNLGHHNSSPEMFGGDGVHGKYSPSISNNQPSSGLHHHQNLTEKRHKKSPKKLPKPSKSRMSTLFPATFFSPRAPHNTQRPRWSLTKAPQRRGSAAAWQIEKNHGLTRENAETNRKAESSPTTSTSSPEILLEILL